jgi:pathogenesis-related protein 1
MRPFELSLASVVLVTACGIDLSTKQTTGSSSVRPGGSEAGRVVGITEAHNAIRADVSASPPLPDLKWSEDLASVAARYAEHLSTSCELVHSGGEYGENLAFFGGQTPTAKTVVDLWASEKSCYTYGAFEQGDRCSSACNGSGGCGHYTQIVWRNTSVVGCGVAACTGTDGEIWVCNYDPPGNFVGEMPY